MAPIVDRIWKIQATNTRSRIDSMSSSVLQQLHSGLEIRGIYIVPDLRTHFAEQIK